MTKSGAKSGAKSTESTEAKEARIASGPHQSELYRATVRGDDRSGEMPFVCAAAKYVLAKTWGDPRVEYRDQFEEREEQARKQPRQTVGEEE